MSLGNSYFALSPALNPLRLIDQWLNPFRHQCTVLLRDNPIAVSWTQRAQRAMEKRTLPLTVEMQLLFSCVVKKRVLFQDRTNAEAVAVNKRLLVAFHPAQAAVCDPVEFALNYPVKRHFDSPAAAKMHPRWLRIDYKDNCFAGEFGV